MTPVNVENGLTNPVKPIEYRLGVVGKAPPDEVYYLNIGETLRVVAGAVAYIGNQNNREFKIVGTQGGGEIWRRGLMEELQAGDKSVDPTAGAIMIGDKRAA